MNEVSLEKIDLCDLVIAGCRRVEDLADAKGVMLDWYLPEQAVFVQGDRILIQRLLGILLDNAIKYTPEHGEIRVELAATVSSTIIRVIDTGIGMSRVDQDRVFDRFYQADLREKTQPGSGLGLSIARWIAEAHHAQLTVQSIPLEGSTFTIQFPSGQS